MDDQLIYKFCQIDCSWALNVSHKNLRSNEKVYSLSRKKKENLPMGNYPKKEKKKSVPPSFKLVIIKY